DGSYTYTLDNAKPPVEALSEGQQVTDVFSYTNSDNHGGSSSANLTITVTRTNDAPVVAAPENLVANMASGTTPLELTAPTDAEGDPLTVKVSTLPAAGTIKLGTEFGGGAVSVGQSLTLAQLHSLTYTAPDAGTAVL